MSLLLTSFKTHALTLRTLFQELYADTPIDASLLSLYIHQNYTQYCTTLDECDALMDTLSYVDASGGESVRPSVHFLSIASMRADIEAS